MLLSRFWYVVLSLLLGVAAFGLFLAVSMYNRAGNLSMGQALSSDSQVVAVYLKDDARTRSAHLIQFALDADIAKFLAKSSESEAKVPQDARDKVLASLRKVNEKIPADQAFDAVFAVDQHGRVVAFLGYEQASGMEDFELGGYPVVADALHGYIRDDTLVLDRIYRVVARPVEHDIGQLPAGAIVGARIVDPKYARELSDRTGASVAFYVHGQNVASAAPEGFDKSQLDLIVSDLKAVESDPDYMNPDLGRSSIRTIGKGLGVQYTRLPGEAWELGAGYAVGRLPTQVDSPMGFFKKADDKDRQSVPVIVVVLIALGAAALGLLFSLFEHTRPLWIFRTEAQKLAKGKLDQLHPSKFRGVYRKIAADLNDGIDQVAAKGGVPRRAADLQQVLGDLPQEPQMSAFSFPGDATSSAPVEEPSHPGLPSSPSNPRLPKAPPPRVIATPASHPPGPSPHLEATMPSEHAPPGARPPPPRHPGMAAPAAAGGNGSSDLAEWRAVYEEFVRTKQQCGESTDGFTYEKFEQTLKKNRDALVQRHGAKRVRFSVYVKEGKAALKASPIKE